MMHRYSPELDEEQREHDQQMSEWFKNNGPEKLCSATEVESIMDNNRKPKDLVEAVMDSYPNLSRERAIELIEAFGG